jgi:putative oxidoreductase
MMHFSLVAGWHRGCCLKSSDDALVDNESDLYVHHREQADWERLRGLSAGGFSDRASAVGACVLVSVSGCRSPRLAGAPGTPGVSWGNFTNFLAYCARVNSFAPAAIVPILGVTSTVLEILFALALLLGLCTRLAAIGAGVLLFLFGSAMAISFGIKSPFDYSVFSAMGGSLLLAVWGAYPLSADSLYRQLVRRFANGRAESRALLWLRTILFS